MGLQGGEGVAHHAAQLVAPDPLLPRHRVDVVREVQDVAPLEVARVAHVVDARQEPRLFRAEQLPDLRRGPEVEGALLVRAVLPLRVGVARRVEGAVRGREVLEQVVERLLRDRAEVVRAEEVGPGQRLREEGVVVEHLLEVRHQPARVHGVAVEAAPGVVADPARRHPRQRVDRHADPVRVRSPGPQQEVEKDGLGELGRSAEPPVRRVEAASGRAHRVLDQPAAGCAFGTDQRVGIGGAAPERAGQLGARAVNVGAPVPVRLADAGQHLAEGRHAVAGLRREVGSPVKRHPLGSEEGGQRPAAVTGQRLHRPHVYRVDVGPLLAIHLDVDEGVVHQARGRGILEGLALHDVAPVARRVADGEQDGTIRLPRQRERLVAPRVPVHGVVRVLQQVGTGLGGEAVGHGGVGG